MMRSARPAGRTLAVTAAVGFLGSGLLLWQIAMPEHGLEGSFRQAVTQNSPRTLKTASGAALPAATFGAGLWLSGLETQPSREDAQSMEIGSQVTMLARDGETRHLEVVDVRPAATQLHTVNAPTSSAMVLVTLRPVGQTSGGEVRILVETGSSLRPGATPARAL